MPLFDHRCPSGHLFEAYAEPSEERIRCRIRGCRRMASRVWVSRSTFERDAAPFIPPVIFRKHGNGHVLFPGRSDEKPPRGYERVELNTVSAIRRFEREQNEEGRRQHNDILVREQMRHDFVSSRVRSDLERTARQGPQNLRAYAERALARLDSRNFSERAAKFSPGFNLEAFSYDASNRHYCDDRRDMRDRQRR